MCYSAQASFTASALLLPAGVYCIRTALRKERTYLPLAAIPAVFSVQQFGEGLVWVGLDQDDAGLVRTASLLFLFFALAFWPFWLPLCAAFLERRPHIRRLLGMMTVLSLVWAAILYVPILTDADRWLTTRVVHHSVQYNYWELPVYELADRTVLRLLYLLTIVVPWSICANANFKWFGVLFAASAVVSHLAFTYAFVSVWCFLAALLSLYLCYVLAKLPVPTAKRQQVQDDAAHPEVRMAQ